MVTFPISSNCVRQRLACKDNKRKQVFPLTPVLALPQAIDLDIGDFI